MRSLTTKYSKGSNGSRPRNIAAALVGAALAVTLSACSSLLPATYERDVPKAIAAADVGAVGVDTSTHWEGFSKAITVRIEFGSTPVTGAQFRETLAAVSGGLGLNAGASLLLTFYGPTHEDAGGVAEAEGVAEAAQELNRELGLSGDLAIDDDNALVRFSSGKELQSLVKEMRKAGLL